MSLFVNEEDVAENAKNKVLLGLKPIVESMAAEYVSDIFEYGLSGIDPHYPARYTYAGSAWASKMWLEKQIASCVVQFLNQYESNIIDKKVDVYIKSEAFIDAIVKRIKDKQLI